MDVGRGKSEGGWWWKKTMLPSCDVFQALAAWDILRAGQGTKSQKKKDTMPPKLPHFSRLRTCLHATACFLTAPEDNRRRRVRTNEPTGRHVSALCEAARDSTLLDHGKALLGGGRLDILFLDTYISTFFLLFGGQGGQGRSGRPPNGAAGTKIIVFGKVVELGRSSLCTCLMTNSVIFFLLYSPSPSFPLLLPCPFFFFCCCFASHLSLSSLFADAELLPLSVL